MKIELTRNSKRRLTFGDVKVGELFKDEDGELFIKTEDYFDKNKNSFNAIYLEDGNNSVFDDDEYINLYVGKTIEIEDNFKEFV